jgi:hypothetical protein
MAYQLSKSGSDWKTIKVKAIGANGEPSDLPDVCEYVRFSGISWTRDGDGFFYSRYSASVLALRSQRCILQFGLFASFIACVGSQSCALCKSRGICGISALCSSAFV